MADKNCAFSEQSNEQMDLGEQLQSLDNLSANFEEQLRVNVSAETDDYSKSDPQVPYLAFLYSSNQNHEQNNVPANCVHLLHDHTEVADLRHAPPSLQLHFRAVEEPQNERLRLLSEIGAELRADLDLARLATRTLNELLSACFILFVYVIFRDAVRTVRAYLADVEFKNHFLTHYFWRLDLRRRLAGLPHLGRVKRAEKRAYHLRSPYR